MEGGGGGLFAQPGLLVSLMDLRLMLVDQNPFQPFLH